MNNEKYLALMSSLNYCYDNEKQLTINWNNGLIVSCTSITGEYETDTEPGDEDYIGEYAAAVGDVKVLQQGTDSSVEIYNDCIEISLKCIPKKVSLEDGTVLWENND